MDKAPGMWPALYSSTGRTSKTVTAPFLTSSRSALRSTGSIPSLPSRKRAEKLTDRLIGQPVDNKLTLFFGRHQAGCPQDLQMLGGIGDGQTGFFRQNLYSSPTLAKQIQQLQSFRAGNRFSDACKLFVNFILKRTIWVFHIRPFKYSID
jgi:hypothetical protein